VSRVIGGTMHLSASSPAPGVVRWRAGNGLIIGEPDGAGTTRLAALAGVLRAAGLDVTVSARIRDDVWYKLWGNLTLNPICAITGSTAGPALDDDLVREFCSAAMLEAREIGARIGCPIAQTPEDRHAVTRKLGDFVPSMLQDARAGRPLELDALTGAVRELGLLVGVPTPYIDALHGLARLYVQARAPAPPPDLLGAEDGGVVEDGLPGQLGGADEDAVVEGAGLDGDAGTAAPGAAEGYGLAELVGGGLEQVAEQAAEQDQVGVDHVDQVGEAEAEVLYEGVGGLPDARV
jgi:ketopantoate reductase PanE/ApbA-like protein